MEMRVRIYGDKWTIRLVDDNEMLSERDDGDKLAGLTIVDDHLILIHEDSLNLTTIWHELYHAYVSYLYLDDTNELKIDDIEEIFAAQFGDKGFEMVKKGKEIYKQLVKERKG